MLTRGPSVEGGSRRTPIKPQDANRLDAATDPAACHVRPTGLVYRRFATT
ncbi:hypothetical protein GCM10009872_28020 [Actinopolymorpha rutila]